MTTLQVLIVLCGLAAVLYGLVTSRQILSLGSGNDKMQEIASAIQEGARAYLNRQYMTISIVGVVIFALIWIVFDLASGIGFLIGAFFSGAAGYVGMNISVRSNVRTTHAASKSLAEGLSVSFKAGAGRVSLRRTREASEVRGLTVSRGCIEVDVKCGF